MRAVQVFSVATIIVIGAQLAIAQERQGELVTDADLFRVRGFVVDSEGTPVAGASVVALAETDGNPLRATTGARGEFQIDGIFGNGLRLSAASIDLSQQASVWIASPDVRSRCRTPLEMRLAPSGQHSVFVQFDGKPVASAKVVGTGFAFQSVATTDAEGTATIRFPANDVIRELVAWHPEFGIAGVRDADGHTFGEQTPLPLHPSDPITIQVLDIDRKPVADLEVRAGFRVNDASIPSPQIEEAAVRTDVAGNAVIPWAPKGVTEGLHMDVISRDWKVNEVERVRLPEKLATVLVARRESVKGKVVLPNDEDPAGLFITGRGFGPASNGDIPRARVRNDGTFSLLAADAHGYILGVADSEWASDIWTGELFATSSDPVVLEISAYAATPLVSQVTRGPSDAPVVGAYIQVSTEATVEWTPGNESREGNGSVGYWLRTDASGLARAGVGRGHVNVRLSTHTWSDEKEIDVQDNKPIEISFHRDWLDKRLVAGLLMRDGRPYSPSKKLVGHSWTYENGRWKDSAPKVDEAGNYQVSADAEEMTLLFMDNGVSGFARLDATPITTIEMLPTARYSGTILDEHEQPLASQDLELMVIGMHAVAVKTTTDDAGRFEFSDVPVGMALRLVPKHGSVDRDQRILGGERLFEPAEIRNDDRVILRRLSAVPQKKVSTKPLQVRLASVSRDAHSAHMLGLAVLVAKNSDALAEAILDYDQNPAILNYLPLQLDLATEKDVIDTKWPLPESGEVALILLDENVETVGSTVVGSRELSLAKEFLANHALPRRDARVVLAEAKNIAAASNRRVWLVEGGPRCGPCFLFGRWLASQHELLEKDYVIVKLTGGIDEHVTEVMKPYSDEKFGIPFHVIVEPDGVPIITSEGPLGNIGMPSSVEGIRHLKKMLEATTRTLTAEEIDALVESLNPSL